MSAISLDGRIVRSSTVSVIVDDLHSAIQAAVELVFEFVAKISIMTLPKEVRYDLLEKFLSDTNFFKDAMIFSRRFGRSKFNNTSKHLETFRYDHLSPVLVDDVVVKKNESTLVFDLLTNFVKKAVNTTCDTGSASGIVPYIFTFISSFFADPGIRYGVCLSVIENVNSVMVRRLELPTNPRLSKESMKLKSAIEELHRLACLFSELATLAIGQCTPTTAYRAQMVATSGYIILLCTAQRRRKAPLRTKTYYTRVYILHSFEFHCSTGR
jgi:hypothetical protein